MPFDDEIGARLRDEAGRLPAEADAAAVLAGLRPDMRRARRLRQLTHGGVAALLLIGGVALARVGTGGDDGALEIVPAVGPDDPAEPPSGPEVESETTMTGRTITSTTSPSTDDEDDTEAVRTEAGQPAPAPDSVPRSTPADDDPPHQSAGVNDRPSTSAPTQSQTGAPPQPRTDDRDDDHDDDRPATTTAPGAATSTTVDDHHDGDDEHHDGASTTSSPTTTTTPEATRFDSACGYVLADTSGSKVEIVEIVPEPGYRAKVESGDGGSLKVHFEGGGEDCEFAVS